MNRSQKECGFTLIEILLVVAVIAILGMISVIGYQSYAERSRAADIVVKYDAVRSSVGAEIAQGGLSNCAEIVQRLGNTNLADEYARLAYGFEAVPGGYRPVLTVCAKVDRNGPLGVKVAHSAHDTLARTARVEKGAVLTETLVSFALPITDSDKPVCTIPYGGTLTACGDPVAVPAPTTAKTPDLAPTTTPTPQASATPSITSCPPGQFLLDIPGGGKQCWTPPSCANANEVYYLGNQKCYPKPATPCDQPSLLTWVDGTGPVCQDPSGGITPLQVAQPPAGSTGPAAGTGTGTAQGGGSATSSVTAAKPPQPPQPPQPPKPPAGPAPGAGTGTAQGGAASATSSLTAAQQHQQCTANCRSLYPHGNSIGYRNCMAACK